VDHRKYALNTGGVIPVLVKAEKVPGKRPVREGEKYTTIKTCTAEPPKISGTGDLPNLDNGLSPPRRHRH
jgi:hypothetical protein